MAASLFFAFRKCRGGRSAGQAYRGWGPAEESADGSSERKADRAGGKKRRGKKGGDGEEERRRGARREAAAASAESGSESEQEEAALAAASGEREDKTDAGKGRTRLEALREVAEAAEREGKPRNAGAAAAGNTPHAAKKSKRAAAARTEQAPPAEGPTPSPPFRQPRFDLFSPDDLARSPESTPQRQRPAPPPPEQQLAGLSPSQRVRLHARERRPSSPNSPSRLQSQRGAPRAPSPPLWLPAELVAIAPAAGLFTADAAYGGPSAAPRPAAGVASGGSPVRQAVVVPVSVPLSPVGGGAVGVWPPYPRPGSAAPTPGRTPVATAVRERMLGGRLRRAAAAAGAPTDTPVSPATQAPSASFAAPVASPPMQAPPSAFAFTAAAISVASGAARGGSGPGGGGGSTPLLAALLDGSSSSADEDSAPLFSPEKIGALKARTVGPSRLQGGIPRTPTAISGLA